MRKNPHDRILKKKPKEQHLSIVPKSYPSNYTFSNFNLTSVHPI